MKLVYCICRKPELSRDEFVRYWAEVHADFAPAPDKRMQLAGASVRKERSARAQIEESPQLMRGPLGGCTPR